MRTYLRNSPQAAARIVALAMLADGHLCNAEWDALECVDAYTQLELSAAELHAIVHALSADLVSPASESGRSASQIESVTIATLLTEIDDPALRVKVLRLCLTVFAADGYLSEGESVMLTAADEQWGQHHKKKALPHPQPEAAHV